MTLEQFIKDARWQRADNYMGPDMTEYLTGPSQSRDSEALDQSNFDTALEMLGGENEDAGVEVHRFGHWACGWYEQIMVRADNKTAVQKLYEIYKALEHYPVLDEDDFYQREYDARQEFAESEQSSLAKALVEHLGLPEEMADDADMLELAYQLNMECQAYAGNDSCINVYSCREPDDYSLNRLINILEQLEYYNLTDNPACQYVCVALNVEVRS